MTQLLDAVPCDGCDTLTADPTICDHDRMLCPDCTEHWACRYCAMEATEESSW